MDKIDVGAPFAGDRRSRPFARSAGTKFALATEGASTTVDLYDEIGWYGVTAKDFRAQLKDVKGDFTLRINSPGGDVFDGIAIYNDLLAHDGKVTVEVTGMAASIASIIAMAGDEIVIAENAFFMVHNAWTFAIGNRHDMANQASVLGKIDDALARTYAARTTSGIRTIKQMMDDETWMSAKDAVDGGFADRTSSISDAKAKFDVSVFAGAPKELGWHPEDDEEPITTKRDFERALTQDAGWSRSKARAAMRVIETSKNEPLQDAGGVELSGLALALQRARAAIHTPN